MVLQPLVVRPLPGRPPERAQRGLRAERPGGDDSDPVVAHVAVAGPDDHAEGGRGAALGDVDPLGEPRQRAALACSQRSATSHSPAQWAM